MFDTILAKDAFKKILMDNGMDEATFEQEWTKVLQAFKVIFMKNAFAKLPKTEQDKIFDKDYQKWFDNTYKYLADHPIEGGYKQLLEISAKETYKTLYK